MKQEDSISVIDIDYPERWKKFSTLYGMIFNEEDIINLMEFCIWRYEESSPEAACDVFQQMIDMFTKLKNHSFQKSKEKLEQ